MSNSLSVPGTTPNGDWAKKQALLPVENAPLLPPALLVACPIPFSRAGVRRHESHESPRLD